MATTGELRAIVQELHLVDIGDAASYLGEETVVEEEYTVPAQPALILATESLLAPELVHLATCDCTSCAVVHA